MKPYESQATTLKVMGHPVRLQILDMLRQGEICVCHIEQTLNKRQAYVSQQLMTLRDAGLVDSRKDGLQVYYRITNDQALEVLNLFLGTSSTNGIDVIDGCRCPNCSTIRILEIE